MPACLDTNIIALHAAIFAPLDDAQHTCRAEDNGPSSGPEDGPVI